MFFLQFSFAVFLTCQVIAGFVERKKREGLKLIRVAELIRAENWHEEQQTFNEPREGKRPNDVARWNQARIHPIADKFVLYEAFRWSCQSRNETCSSLRGVRTRCGQSTILDALENHDSRRSEINYSSSSFDLTNRKFLRRTNFGLVFIEFSDETRHADVRCSCKVL